MKSLRMNVDTQITAQVSLDTLLRLLINFWVGYQRRQVRFYFWKVFSQLTAMLFYILVSIVLRFGPNSEYYPFSDSPFVEEGSDDEDDEEDEYKLSSDDYRNSLTYAGGNMVIILLSGIVGFLLVRFAFRKTYTALKTIYLLVLLRNRYYTGKLFASL